MKLKQKKIPQNQKMSYVDSGQGKPSENSAVNWGIEQEPIPKKGT